MNTGIEKIAVYPGSMALSMPELVDVRGADRQLVIEQMLIDERSVNPPWEDPVTLAVNAANRMLTDADRRSIGLLIVATETGLDQEKSLSTWVQRYLNLPDDCRNFEIKIACYGGSAALFAARGALSLLPQNKKVLVITTDVSRKHFGKPYEFVMGCGAVAFIVSRTPKFFQLTNESSAVYTYEVSDLIRPTSRVEAGHSETSLLSYLEGIATTFERYMEQDERAERYPNLETFRQAIPYQIYHAPFSGITLRAHKAVHKYFGRLNPEYLKQDYTDNVLPSLQYNRRMGGTYAASVFISMVGLVDAKGEDAKTRACSIYSYGSGSCAEFYTGVFGSDAPDIAHRCELEKQLQARKKLTVAEYELAENIRDELVDQGDFSVPKTGFESWYEQFYAGQNKLVLSGATDYVREYAWS